jgi:hypothetical protein
MTTREAVRGSLAIIERHPEKGMGLVVNAVRDLGRSYHHYAGAYVNGTPNGKRRFGRLIKADREAPRSEAPRSQAPPPEAARSEESRS